MWRPGTGGIKTLQFDGSTNYLTIPASLISLTRATIILQMTANFAATSGTLPYLFDSDTSRITFANNIAGQLTFSVGSSSTLTETVAWSAGQRLHLACQYDQPAGKLGTSVNGDNRGFLATSWAVPSAGSNLYAMSAFNGTRNTPSGLEAVFIYNRYLSNKEVTAHYLEPYAAFVPASKQRFYSLPVFLPAPPATPTGLTATNAPAPVLNWTASTGAATYNVLRRLTGGGAYSTLITLVAATTYTDTSASPGNSYDYEVQAVNAGGTSAASSSATGYTQPTAPVQLAGTSGSGQVTLSAGAPAGAGTVTYNVYDGTSVGAEGGTTVLSGQTVPGSMVVTGLTNGTKYFFFATAQNAAGESAHSNETGVIPALSSGGGGRRVTQGFA